MKSWESEESENQKSGGVVMASGPQNPVFEPTKIKCPICGKILIIARNLLTTGQRITCNYCKTVFIAKKKTTTPPRPTTLPPRPKTLPPRSKTLSPGLPLLPLSSTTLSETPSQKEKGICEYCKKEISQEVVKCPNCNEWRADIKKDFAHLTLGALFMLVTILLLPYVIIKYNWWPKYSTYKTYRPGSFGDFVSAVGGGRKDTPWHKSILIKTYSQPEPGPGRIRAPNILGVDKEYRLKFSIVKFLTSWQGWFVLVVIGLLIHSVRDFIVRYNRLKEKKVIVIDLFSSK